MNDRFPCPRCGLGTQSWGFRCLFRGAFAIPNSDPGPTTPRSLVREISAFLLVLAAAALLLAWVTYASTGGETARQRWTVAAFACYGAIVGARGLALYRTGSARFATAGAAAALLSFVAASVLVFATRPFEVGAVLSLFILGGALRVVRTVKLLRRLQV